MSKESDSPELRERDRVRRRDSRFANDQRLGAFVTNKWLVGLLVGLVMSMGGYIFKGIDKGSEAQAVTISELQKMVAGHDISLATITATLRLNHEDIIRRLSAIEVRLERRTSVTGPPDRVSAGTYPNCTEKQIATQAGTGEWYCGDRAR